MQPTPLYRPETLNSPAYQLRYVWSGWPSGCRFPSAPSAEAFTNLKTAWEADGLRCLESRWSPEIIQLAFSAKPQVSPVLLASRVKGRLQYALRTAGTPVTFSRKVCVRTVGENTTQQVEQYVMRQVDKEPLADPRFKEFLEQFLFEDSQVDLRRATESQRGAYWYNLHCVLVRQQRYRVSDTATLTRMRDCSIAVANKKGHRISALSLMPDHIHMALRGNIEHSPEDIALGFMNNLAYAMGQNAIWMPSYYAGTFGEYDMNAVRQHVRKRD